MRRARSFRHFLRLNRKTGEIAHEKPLAPRVQGVALTKTLYLRIRRVEKRYQKMPSPFVAVSLFTNLFLATRETVFRITINGELKRNEDLFV